MDVRALIIVGANAELSAAPEAAPHGSRPETLAGVPLALVDVLGRPVLHHLAAQLREAGIQSISVVAEPGDAAVAALHRAQLPGVAWTEASGQDCWRACLGAFHSLAQNGAELVLVFRLGPYTEVNFDELIQFHLDQCGRITCVNTPAGISAGVFVISASRRNDAAYLFRHQLLRCRVPAAEYVYDGYFNPLHSARDLRQLAIDALYGGLRLRPAGRQLKPGVWIGDGARVHPRARVLAPAFIGPHARIRARALLTRAATIEHHGVVDCGSVVENSSVLPYVYVGPGLDLSQCVVGFHRLAHLRRGVEVDIADAKLLGTVTASTPLRLVSGAAALAAYLPVQLLRGMLAKSHRRLPAEIPQSVQDPAEVLQDPELFDQDPPDARKFSPDLIIARRYGNQ